MVRPSTTVYVSDARSKVLTDAKSQMQDCDGKDTTRAKTVKRNVLLFKPPSFCCSTSAFHSTQFKDTTATTLVFSPKQKCPLYSPEDNRQVQSIRPSTLRGHMNIFSRVEDGSGQRREQWGLCGTKEGGIIGWIQRSSLKPMSNSR